MGLYRDDIESRQKVVEALRHLVDTGLTSGSSGNVSLRTDQGMLVTPLRNNRWTAPLVP